MPPVVTDLVGRFSYEIASGLRGEASVKLGDKIFSLQKVSSLVLSEVKELAERWLNEPVTRRYIERVVDQVLVGAQMQLQLQSPRRTR